MRRKVRTNNRGCLQPLNTHTYATAHTLWHRVCTMIKTKTIDGGNSQVCLIPFQDGSTINFLILQMTQTLDPFSFSDFLFKLGCSSICFVSETESCHVAHELSQLLHVNHLELISKNDTLEIEEGKKNLFSLDHILKTVHMGPLSHLPSLQPIN